MSSGIVLPATKKKKKKREKKEEKEEERNSKQTKRGIFAPCCQIASYFLFGIRYLKFSH